MKRIKILLTGGTIGSFIQDGTAALSDHGDPRLIDRHRAARPQSTASFDAERILNIHSENITYDDWSVIYKRIRALDGSAYSGVILTHGTDTLGYSAAFLQLMLRHMTIPVLIVSSDYPLEDNRANGYDNFVAAADFIEHCGMRGVFVPFAKNGRTLIHSGAKLQQIPPFTHDASSAGAEHGVMEHGRFVPGISTPDTTDADFGKLPEIERFRDVLYIAPHPGLNYGHFSFSVKPAAILHGLYHSSTACAATADARHSIIKFAERCRAQGIDVYAAPADTGTAQYPAYFQMRDAGIYFLHGVTLETAYAKLVIAYGAFTDESERREFLRL